MFLFSRLNRRIALGSAAATAVTGLGFVSLASVGQAVAAPPGRDVATPQFLDVTELPPSPHDPWQASPVRPGRPINIRCAPDAVPSTGTTHRSFGTELAAWGLQTITVTPDATRAARLSAEIEQAIRGCAAAYEQNHPGGSASWRAYGTINVENGAQVYGVHTAHPDAEPAILLFAVGRDAGTVTLVQWAHMGGYQHAPIASFLGTAWTGVEKMYRPA
jgi:hypothetical protein